MDYLSFAFDYDCNTARLATVLDVVGGLLALTKAQ